MIILSNSTFVRHILMVSLILLSSASTLCISSCTAQVSGQPALPQYPIELSNASTLPTVTLQGARNETLLLTFTIRGVDPGEFHADLIQADSSPAVEMKTFLLSGAPANNSGDFLVDGLIPLQAGSDTPGGNLQVLVRIQIPGSHPAGTFHHQIAFRSPARSVLQPLEIRVWNFLLPDDLPITILANLRPGAEWFARYGVHGPDSLETVLEAYLKSMREYKINAVAGFYALHTKSFTKGQSVEDDPRFVRMLQLVVEKYGYRYFRLPFDAGRKGIAPALLSQSLESYFPSMLKFLTARGWTDRALVKLWDEPKREAFPEVASVYNTFRTAFPQLRTECTGWSPSPEVARAVSIWAVGARLYDADKVNAARNLGEEIWLYANKLHGVDRLPAHQRLIGWHLYRYDFKGYYLWGVNYWPQDPWTTPPDKTDYFRRAAFFYPNPANGMPWPTLRLESLLRGFQDYQYLTLLKAAAAAGTVRPADFQAIEREVANLTDDLVNTNPRADWMQMENIRVSIGRLLDPSSAVSPQ